MALVLNDRVKETTTTTGTGALTLGGAVTGFETFASGIGNSNTTYYAVILPGSAEFEVGLGTLSSDSSTIARTTIISSSNSDSAVNFSAGTKNIFCTIPASKSVFLDASGNVTLGADLSVGDDLTVNGGVIELKNTGAQSELRMYCESANAHYAALKAPAHSDFAGNTTLTLPATTDVIVGRATTDTLTNKTLTSPKINENVAVTATATEINILDGVTSTTAELNILDGVTSTASELNILDGVTSTASELNLVDGSSAGTIVNSKAVVYGSSGEVNATTLQIAGTSITSSASELNILDGVTSTASELNILDGVTSTASELNILDGVTSTTAELNILDGVTATTAELNILDGVTATTAELNHVDGVTSAIQTQLNAKAGKGFAVAMAIAL